MCFVNPEKKGSLWRNKTIFNIQEAIKIEDRDQSLSVHGEVLVAGDCRVGSARSGQGLPSAVHAQLQLAPQQRGRE